MVNIKKSPYKGDDMKQFAKKTLAATTIALIMTSGATAALADDSSSTTIPTSSIPTSSTSVPKKRDEVKPTSAQRAAYATALQTYRTALTNYIKSKVAIEKAFGEAMRAANSTRTAAREAAVTAQEKKAIYTTFITAMSAAHAAHSSALAALGSPPVKPVKAGESNN
jgi:hypothetical protein